MDYELQNSMVTFPVGSMNGNTMPVNFTVIDDLALEGTHNFSIGIVAIQTPSGPDSLLTIGSPDSAEVIIDDNERMSVLKPLHRVLHLQALHNFL